MLSHNLYAMATTLSKQLFISRLLAAVLLLCGSGLLVSCQGPTVHTANIESGNQVIVVEGLGKPSEFRFMRTEENGSGTKVWLISRQQDSNLEDWPEIIYGVVPPGFKQEVPANSPPPPLLEGERYEILAVESGGSGVAVNFFTYHGGRLLPPEQP